MSRWKAKTASLLPMARFRGLFVETTLEDKIAVKRTHSKKTDDGISIEIRVGRQRIVIIECVSRI